MSSWLIRQLRSPRPEELGAQNGGPRWATLLNLFYHTGRLFQEISKRRALTPRPQLLARHWEFKGAKSASGKTLWRVSLSPKRPATTANLSYDLLFPELLPYLVRSCDAVLGFPLPSHLFVRGR